MAGHRPRAGLALTAALVAAAGARAGHPQAAATPQQPTFPAEIELVTVDAAVVDRSGRAIRGLTASDFTVLEDGRPQAISSFEAIELPDSPRGAGDEPRERPRISTNARDAARTTGRTFVVVFDNRNLTQTDAHRAKGAISQFLEKGRARAIA